MGNFDIDYGALMDTALRQVIAKAIAQVAEHGLPDGHSFYITIPTDEEGVEMPDWLRVEHPESLSIVLQYEFYNLAVERDHFEVDLSFRNRRARLRIPFHAITVFADPEAQFGLRFKSNEASDAGSGQEPLERADLSEEPTAGVSGDSNVIPFDARRR